MKNRNFLVFVAVLLGLFVFSIRTYAFDWASPQYFSSRFDQNPSPSRFIMIQALASQDIGKWQLVRTPGPEKNDVVSIMHTADALKSDPDFAGLMIRCRPKSRLQIAFVVIRPFPPRAHPRISIAAGSASVQLQASVIPPGSMLSLPDEAEVLAKGSWQSATQLTVDIEDDGTKMHGVMPLENLKSAIAYLQANCPDH